MSELRSVGVTPYGMKKFGIKYLTKVIHDDEHIKGVVYGRYKDKQGSITLNEGLLVATDKRLVFVDHKPGYTDVDEMTYDVVSGIKITQAVFTAVILHTKIQNYEIRFANAKCAQTFVSYVEKRRLESA